MSTLAHVIEERGIATIALGSVRAQLEGTAPPRGLYCDFPFGRPLGKPGDADFQHAVLRHAFSMLDRTEPGIEEFGETISDDAEVLACPMPPRAEGNEHSAVAEARGLRPAYERTIARYGDRMGAFRVIGPDDVPSAVATFAAVANGAEWSEAGIPGVPGRVVQDIRGYYEAAAVSLAEHTPSAFAATRWFQHETETGRVILEARKQMQAQGAEQRLWQPLVSGAVAD